MKPRGPVTALLAALALGVGVSACGGSSSYSGSGTSTTAGASTQPAGSGIAAKSAEAIFKAAGQAADSLKSVYVSGTIDESSGPIALHLHLVAGVGAQGTMSENGASFQVVTLASAVYVNGSAAFLKAAGGGAAAALLAGRWLQAPVTGQYADLVKLGRLRDLVALIFGATHGKLVKTGTKVIEDRPVIGVRDVTEGGMLYVATSGKPYPVALSGTSGSDKGDLLFSDFNAPVKITAPKGAINISDLAAAVS